MIILSVSLLVLIIIVFILKVFFKGENTKEEKTSIPDDCCGAHEVCERDSLLARNDQVVYYDDEELDEFASKTDYTNQEVDLFKEVFYTLKEEDVAGWLRSLQLRNIHLPDVLRDEAMLIISERRGK